MHHKATVTDKDAIRKAIEAMPATNPERFTNESFVKRIDALAVMYAPQVQRWSDAKLTANIDGRAGDPSMWDKIPEQLRANRIGARLAMARERWGRVPELQRFAIQDFLFNLKIAETRTETKPPKKRGTRCLKTTPPAKS